MTEGRPHLFVSPSGSERIERTAEALRALPPRAPAIVLAPSVSAGTLLVRHALEPGSARFGWQRRTLDALALELATRALADDGRQVVRGASLEALCARVLSELAGEGELGRYAEIGERPGFVRALRATLDELRLTFVSHERVSELDADLGRFLARYERLLAAEKLADRAAVLATAAGVVRERRLPALFALDLRLTSVAEARFAAALCERCERAFVTLVHGDLRTERVLAELLPNSARSSSTQPQRSDLDVLKLRLFADPPHPPLPSVERGRVRIVSSPGEGREAVEAVRALLEHARAGVPFDRMAIALRASASYRAVVEEALTRAELPAYFADGVERPHPEGRALLVLLDCAREGLSARDFAEYLSLGVAPRNVADADADADADVNGDAELPRFVSPRRWERLIVDAAVVRGGPLRWQKRLLGLSHALRDELLVCDVDDPRRAALERDLATLAELARFSAPLLSALDALPEGGTWGAWISALSALARMALRAPDSVLEALAELLPLAPVGPVGIHDVQRTLSARLGTLRLVSEGQPAGKVFVGAIDDLLGRSFDVVCALGLAEKVFPPRISEDPLLPDAHRSELDVHLTVSEQRAADERLALRIAVGAACEHLIVSFPRFDMQHNRPRVPSFYGLEVLHAIDGTLPAFDDLSRRAHPGAAPRMGWPAPDDVAQAIDDSEYDLAMLDVLLRRNESARRGAAAYLLTANQHLARALRFRARRWTLARFSPADGFIAASDEAKALLPSMKLAARAYSPTALAALSACPYRFFLHAVARIAPRDEVPVADELDARQSGVLFHAVQRELLRTLRERGALPLCAEGYEEARVLLAQTFERLAREAEEELAPAVERVFREALEGARADLEQWLVRMLDERVFTPAYFELGFGVRSARMLDEASRADSVLLPSGVRVSGVIDLVERAREPGTERPLLRATDHKTGAVYESLGIVSGGRVLQPLLYALALEQLFPDAEVSASRLYFCTRRADFTVHELKLDGSARAVAKDFASSASALIDQGFLPAAPAKGECERCAYRTVCGPYEEQRVPEVKTRDFDKLAPLHKLRNLP